MQRFNFKQIRRLMQEDRFFTAAYIVGTALSIAMVMLVLMIYHLRTADLGAEGHRSRTLRISRGSIVSKEGDSRCSSKLHPATVEKWFCPMKTPEAVTLYGKDVGTVFNGRENRYENLPLTYTDAAYWRVFTFRFLRGRPFTEDEVKGKAHRVVVGRLTARLLFGTDDAVGRPLQLYRKEYTVCGVVEEVPTYLEKASSCLYIPYTTLPSNMDRRFSSSNNDPTPLGLASCEFLLRSPSDEAALRQELARQVRLINTGYTDRLFSIGDQPRSVSFEMFALGDPDCSDESLRHRILVVTVVLCLLLVVPALNLSGLIVARMRKRSGEIAVRKAFGASAAGLVEQMLWENFVQMLLGGILGLLLAFLLFRTLGDSLLFQNDFIISMPGGVDATAVSFWHVVDGTTACYVILLCFALNLLSTLLPAWRYARRPVAETLNHKK